MKIADQEIGVPRFGAFSLGSFPVNSCLKLVESVVNSGDLFVRRVISGCLLALLVSQVGASFAQSNAVNTNKIFWHEDYRLAMQESERSGKPLLLAFRCVP